MKIIFLFGVIMLGFITSSYTPVRTVKKPGKILQTTNRTADCTAPVSTETKDSSALLSDIAAFYNRMEQNIEMAFNELKLDAKNNTSKLEDLIKELNTVVEKTMEQIKKLDSLLKKLSTLEKIIQQLEQEKQNGIQNLNEQKRNAIRQATEFIKQKRSREELQTYSQTIKTQTARAGQDSLRSINLRYKVIQ